MVQRRIDDVIAFRASHEDKATLERVSRRLNLNLSEVGRRAVRVGLQVLDSAEVPGSSVNLIERKAKGDDPRSQTDKYLGGSVAFELGIHIKTEADLKDLNLSEEATKKVAKELTAANGQIGQAAQKAAQQTEQGAQQAVAAHERHQRSVFNLQNAVLPLAGGIPVC